MKLGKRKDAPKPAPEKRDRYAGFPDYTVLPRPLLQQLSEPLATELAAALLQFQRLSAGKMPRYKVSAMNGNRFAQDPLFPHAESYAERQQRARAEAREAYKAAHS